MGLRLNGNFLIHFIVVLATIVGALGTIFHLLDGQKAGAKVLPPKTISVAIPTPVAKITAVTQKVVNGLVPPPPPDATSVWLPALGR